MAKDKKKDEKTWKQRLADEYQDSRHAHRERNVKREEGRQDRKTAREEAKLQAKLQRQQANLDLRNKAFDYMMEDEASRQFMIETARDSYSTVKKAIKIGGIGLLVAFGGFFIFKGVKYFIDNKTAQGRVNAYTKDAVKSNRNFKPEDYQTWADKLYRVGFHQDGHWYNFGVVSYDSAVIKDILNKLKNADDWYALVEYFGGKEVKRGDGEGEIKDLVWYLAQDNSGTTTAKDYQKIIKEKTGLDVEM